MDSEEEGFQGAYLYELLQGIQFLSCDSISRDGPRKRYNGPGLEGTTCEYLEALNSKFELFFVLSVQI